VKQATNNNKKYIHMSTNIIGYELTTKGQVVFIQNDINDIAYISTIINGEHVEAVVEHARTAEYTRAEMLDELQKSVWWGIIL